MENILELIKNTKNLKSLLTNLLHRGPLKTTPGAVGWAGLPCTITFANRSRNDYDVTQA